MSVTTLPPPRTGPPARLLRRLVLTLLLGLLVSIAWTYRHAGEFGADAIELCQIFAAQVAVAIANAELFTDLRSRADQL